MRRPWRAGALVLLAGSLAGGTGACFSDRPTTAPESPGDGGTAVTVSNFAYVPPAISVAPGTVVTWTNADAISHTVTADDGTSFDSSVLGQHKSFQLTAPAPGVYPYHCSLHPFMKGTLTVTGP